MWLCGGGGGGWFEIRRSYGDREERMLRMMEIVRKYGGQDTMARAGIVRPDLRIPPVHLL